MSLRIARGIANRLSKFRSPAGACLSACDGYFSYICMYTGVSQSGEGSILHWSGLLMVIQPAWLLQNKKTAKGMSLKVVLFVTFYICNNYACEKFMCMFVS